MRRPAGPAHLAGARPATRNMGGRARCCPGPCGKALSAGPADYGAPGSGLACGRPEQMLAPAFRVCTEAWLPGADWPAPVDLPLLLLLPALPVVACCAGASTPAQSAPRVSVTVPAAPVCGAGSASVFCAAGVPLSSVSRVYAES